MKNIHITASGEKVIAKGHNILKTVKAEIKRKRFTDINYSDHCEWHDSGTGDCEDD